MGSIVHSLIPPAILLHVLVYAFLLHPQTGRGVLALSAEEVQATDLAASHDTKSS